MFRHVERTESWNWKQMKLHKTISRAGSVPMRAIEGKRTWATPTNSGAVNRDVRQKPIFLELWQTSGPAETPIWLWQLIKQHVHTYSGIGSRGWNWYSISRSVLSAQTALYLDLTHKFCRKTFRGFVHAPWPWIVQTLVRLLSAGVVVIQTYEPFVIPCKSRGWQQTNFVGRTKRSCKGPGLRVCKQHEMD